MSKTGSVTIDVCLSPNVVLPGFVRKPRTRSGGRWRCAAAEVWALSREDASRAAFALKAGLAMLLVLVGEPFRLFGTNAVWSILTVGIMFEYTVGATFNRAVGSLVAGAVAVGAGDLDSAQQWQCGRAVRHWAKHLSSWGGDVVREAAAGAGALRVRLPSHLLHLLPHHRVGRPTAWTTALDRLYAIAMGAALALFINVLVFPAWAGEQLHRELVGSFTAIADTLDDCVRSYLTEDESSVTADDGSSDEPAIEKCRATLNASARINSLASLAKWEPPQGRFRSLFFPWSHHVRVGAVLRHCAYEVVAMHGYLHSEIQAPYGIREAFQEIREASEQAAELVRVLGSDVDGMVHSSSERLSLLKSVHSSSASSSRWRSTPTSSLRPPS